MSASITCATCSEENKSGSTRCARCGAVLETSEETVVDLELAEFKDVQAEMAERKSQQRLDRLLRGLPVTGSGEEDYTDTTG